MTTPATDRRLAIDLDVMLSTLDRMRRLLVDDDHPAAVRVLAALTRARAQVDIALDSMEGAR